MWIGSKTHSFVTEIKKPAENMMKEMVRVVDQLEDKFDLPAVQRRPFFPVSLPHLIFSIVC